MSGLFELSSGDVVGRDFRVVRRLSSGGMGAVYVAEQLSTGTRRALKVMHPQLARDARACARFVQEARLGGMIKSDHVVEVVGAGVDADRGIPWLAMELLEGEDLETRAERVGRLAPAEVLALFEQLCDALGKAHALGVVHRDLKPENLFVADARRPGVPFTLKVLDFGIAKLVLESQSAAARTAAVGSPLWMSPEQTTHDGTVTPAADVWALGLIAFRLLTGRHYWLTASREHASLMALLAEVTTAPLDAASRRAAALGCEAALPAGFDAWFARCVAREPAARFRDAGEAWTALRAALAPPPPAPAPAPRGETLLMTRGTPLPAPAPPAPPPARGRWRGVALGALALVALAAGGGWFYGSHRRGRFARADAARRAEVEALPLPDAGAARLPSPAGLVRVVATPRAVAIDHAARVAAWTEDGRDDLLATLDEAWSEALPLVYGEAVRLRGGRVAAEDRRGGTHGFVINRLRSHARDLADLEDRYARVASVPPSRTVAVYADPALPSRTVYEVLYTLAQGGFPDLTLVVRTTRGAGAIALTSRPPREGVQVGVIVAAEGYVVHAAGGYLQPGCAVVGAAAVTIPRAPAGHDVEALRRCLTEVRARWAGELRDDRSLRVSVGSAVPYGVLAATLVAARERRPGGCEARSLEPGERFSDADCLFPEVALGVMTD